MRFLTTFQIADFADTLVSLFTAFVLGTLIGAERQYRQRTAGLRTSGIVVSSAGGVRSREKMVWDWPTSGDRVIEDLR